MDKGASERTPFGPRRLLGLLVLKLLLIGFAIVVTLRLYHFI